MPAEVKSPPPAAEEEVLEGEVVRPEEIRKVEIKTKPVMPTAASEPELRFHNETGYRLRTLLERDDNGDFDIYILDAGQSRQ